MPTIASAAQNHAPSGLVFVLLVVVLFLYLVFVLLVGVALVVLVLLAPDRILLLVQSFLLSLANLSCPILTKVSINTSLAIPM